MSPRTEEYRTKAAQCDENARQARDPEVKGQFEKLARQWIEMANQADRQHW
jgi:hypothetical protein